MLTATMFAQSADHLLGLLSATMGEFDQAVTHFEEALTFCRNAGYRPELAWTCYDYADMLLDTPTSSVRTGEGDRAKAPALLDESQSICSELGMRPLLKRVQSRRGKLRA